MCRLERKELLLINLNEYCRLIDCKFVKTIKYEQTS